MSNTNKSEGKRLLGYPESYEGPRLRVTAKRDGHERYVYEDGTLDEGSTVLTRTLDKFAKVKVRKGEPAEWVVTERGDEIPRMPIGDYVQILHSLPSAPDRDAILGTLEGQLEQLGVRGLGKTALSESPGVSNPEAVAA